MPDGTVNLVVEDTVAIITLDRPAKLNALSAAMLASLEETADTVDRDPRVRVAIITGAGPRAFCAGADIEAWSALSPLDMWRRWVRDGHRIFDRLARLRQPLIAAINGHALGGGLEIAAAADLRIAEAHAKFGLPEVSIGIVPGWSGTQRLVRRAGAQAVRRLALTGDLITAEAARAIGLADETVPTGAALARAREIARSIASRAPAAVQIAKTLINAAEGEETAAGIEGIAGALAAYTDDAKEGVAGFREKRPPRFADR
jgi:enoyl-CoA hydratase/carnithine racemase